MATNGLSTKWLLGIVLLIFAIPIAWVVEDVSARKECHYTVLNTLLNPLSNQRVSALPYSFTDAMYVDGRWDKPIDWDHTQNILIAYIIDWCNEQIHEYWVNTGQYFVLGWETWERGDDGFPHPAFAYWIDQR